MVKTLLLTAQRRDEVTNMRRSEIDKEGIWVIPAERYKTKRPNHVPLSKDALAIIEAQPTIDDCDLIFPSRAKTPLLGFARSKAKLDKAVLAANEGPRKGAKVEPLPNWTLHDLRRTAKTLMVRAGVRPDISERVLGHVIAGVEGTYDRHSYADEKRDALEKLAAMVERILNPPASNVADFRRKSFKRIDIVSSEKAETQTRPLQTFNSKQNSTSLRLYGRCFSWQLRSRSVRGVVCRPVSALWHATEHPSRSFARRGQTRRVDGTFRKGASSPAHLLHKVRKIQRDDDLALRRVCVSYILNNCGRACGQNPPRGNRAGHYWPTSKIPIRANAAND